MNPIQLDFIDYLYSGVTAFGIIQTKTRNVLMPVHIAAEHVVYGEGKLIALSCCRGT